jgi:hypothetical protein
MDSSSVWTGSVVTGWGGAKARSEVAAFGATVGVVAGGTAGTIAIGGGSLVIGASVGALRSSLSCCCLCHIA